MLELSQDIGRRLRVHELVATGVQISVRDNDLYSKQYQARLAHSTQSPLIIARKAREIFSLNYRWNNKVRAVTVRAINLVPQDEPQQIDLFTNVAYLDKLSRLDDAVEDIRRRFGKRAIFSACLLGDLKMPVDGRDKVRMPGMMYK